MRPRIARPSGVMRGSPARPRTASSSSHCRGTRAHSSDGRCSLSPPGDQEPNRTLTCRNPAAHFGSYVLRDGEGESCGGVTPPASRSAISWIRASLDRQPTTRHSSRSPCRPGLRSSWAVEGAWRFPPRLSRWRRVTLPEAASRGATPHRCAQAASLRTRWGLSESPGISNNLPVPGSASDRSVRLQRVPQAESRSQVSTECTYFRGPAARTVGPLGQRSPGAVRARVPGARSLGLVADGLAADGSEQFRRSRRPSRGS